MVSKRSVKHPHLSFDYQYSINIFFPQFFSAILFAYFLHLSFRFDILYRMMYMVTLFCGLAVIVWHEKEKRKCNLLKSFVFL